MLGEIRWADDVVAGSLEIAEWRVGWLELR